MHNPTIINRKQRGYSLIELSISLAIIGVVIAGSIIGVQNILRTNNVNKVISQTNTATNRIVARLARDENYANATTQNMAQRNVEVWEESAIDRTTANALVVRHAFSNRVLVAPLNANDAATGTEANQGYVYYLTGIPAAACSEVAVGLETLAVSMRITNAAPVTAAPAWGGFGTVVKTPNTAYNSTTVSTACNGSGDGVTNTTTIGFLVPRR
jgi:prepilin-type N-terminal cleavage/methylation domain-containing protein